MEPWASWMGNFVTVVIVSVLAVAELVNDNVPTPPRTVTPVWSLSDWAALCRRVIGTKCGEGLVGRLGAGVTRVLGTMGGYQARTRLVAARGGHDLPTAPLDSVAVLRVCHRRRGGPMDTALRRDRHAAAWWATWIGRWCSAEGRAAVDAGHQSEPRWVGAEIACLAWWIG